MLSYDKWKILNESLGSTVLGLGRKQALGLISNIPGIAEPAVNEREGCAECGEADEVDDEGEDLSADAAVDLEDYGDEYTGDADEVETEVEDEDMEDDVEDEDYEDEEEYDDETEGEDEDFEDEEEVESDEEYEEDDDTDGNKEYEDEDVEFEDEDSDSDTEVSELGMDTQSNENTAKKNGMISEKEWWKSVTNQIGQMTPNGDIQITEAGVADILKFAASSKPDNLADRRSEEMKLTRKVALSPEVKAAVMSYIQKQRGGAGAGANTNAVRNLLALLVALTMDPVMKKNNKKLAKMTALRDMAKIISQMQQAADNAPEEETEEEVEVTEK
jgi:hypothetical protein